MGHHYKATFSTLDPEVSNHPDMTLAVASTKPPTKMLVIPALINMVHTQ